MTTTYAAAIKDKLIADSEFMQSIGVFREEPSVVIGAVIPAEIKLGTHSPVCRIDANPYGGNHIACEVRQLPWRLFFYGQDAELTQAAAKRARALLNRWQASTDEGEIIGSLAGEVQKSPTDDPTITGLFLTITLTVQE